MLSVDGSEWALQSASLEWLVTSGRQYRLEGGSVPALCEANAAVAAALGRAAVASAWLILAALYPHAGPQPPQPQT